MPLMPDPARASRPVLRADDDGRLLRRHRALDRAALRARPARHRQEGRGLHDVARHRRQGRVRPGGGVLHFRRRPLHHRHVQYRVPASTVPSCRPTAPNSRWATPAPPARQGRLLPVPPVDSCQDIRSEMLSVMAEMGVTVEKHHHEVASAQHELGEVRADDPDRRPHAGLQVRGPQRRPGLRQDGDLHAQARIRRQRLGHARAPVDLEGRQPMFAGNKYADLSRCASTTSAAS